jgi:hypothetical protein
VCCFVGLNWICFANIPRQLRVQDEIERAMEVGFFSSFLFPYTSSEFSRAGYGHLPEEHEDRRHSHPPQLVGLRRGVHHQPGRYAERERESERERFYLSLFIYLFENLFFFFRASIFVSIEITFWMFHREVILFSLFPSLTR